MKSPESKTFNILRTGSGPKTGIIRRKAERQHAPQWLKHFLPLLEPLTISTSFSIKYFRISDDHQPFWIRLSPDYGYGGFL